MRRVRSCQYCRQTYTHEYTPPGETYVMRLCEHHYWKVVDMNGEDE